MADSDISLYENSQQDGNPVECYRFTIGNVTYQYTSHHDEVIISINENGLQRTETYSAEYIERETIKPASKGDSASMVVTVSKDFVIAKMYQGPPPEAKVKLQIIRLHGQDHTAFDIIFTGRVAQASFEDSVCRLTVKMESYMNKEIPNGKRQFTCCNVVYDSKCQLKKADWTVPAFVDKVDRLNVYSSTFANYPDSYFNNGIFQFNGNVRQIVEHVGNRVKLKYPFLTLPQENVIVAPGCDHLFSTCAKKFKNTLNFTGCLYIPPANPEHTGAGRGTYWVDTQVIERDTDGFIGTISL